MPNIFENSLKKSLIFKDESKLDINFIPKRLPHRSKELSLLSQLFLTLLTNPNKTSRKILITGKKSLGKTRTVKFFAEMLKEASKKRDVLIKYVYINCRKERTSFKVLMRIIRSLNNNFPKGRYSLQDLHEIIDEYLNSQNAHLLLILEDLNYLISNERDLIYTLTELNENSNNYSSTPQRVSIIGIVQEISSLINLDNSTLRTLQKNIIRFNDYSSEQIFDILKYRAEISLRDNVISDELIEMITDIVSGDMEYGLKFLWKASKIAERKHLNIVTAECITIAKQDLVLSSTLNALSSMSIQMLLFFLSIVRILGESEESYIPLNEIIIYYQALCEEKDIVPHSLSQLNNFLRTFKKEDFLSLKLVNKKIEGIEILSEIRGTPLSRFEELLVNTLSSKGIPKYKMKREEQYEDLPEEENLEEDPQEVIHNYIAEHFPNTVDTTQYSFEELVNMVIKKEMEKELIKVHTAQIDDYAKYLRKKKGEDYELSEDYEEKELAEIESYIQHLATLDAFLQEENSYDYYDYLDFLEIEDIDAYNKYIDDKIQDYVEYLRKIKDST